MVSLQSHSFGAGWGGGPLTPSPEVFAQLLLMGKEITSQAHDALAQCHPTRRSCSTFQPNGFPEPSWTFKRQVVRNSHGECDWCPSRCKLASWHSCFICASCIHYITHRSSCCACFHKAEGSPPGVWGKGVSKMCRPRWSPGKRSHHSNVLHHPVTAAGCKIPQTACDRGLLAVQTSARSPRLLGPRALPWKLVVQLSLTFERRPWASSCLPVHSGKACNCSPPGTPRKDASPLLPPPCSCPSSNTPLLVLKIQPCSYSGPQLSCVRFFF